MEAKKNKEKYELRNDDPDEIVAATPTYIFLSNWSIPIFIATIALISAILMAIKIPSVYRSKVILSCEYSNTRQPCNILYGKIQVPENLLSSVHSGVLLNIQFFNLSDSKKYNIKGEIDTVYIDQVNLKYFADISAPLNGINIIANGSSYNANYKLPAEAVIIFSKKSIISHFF